MDRETHDQGSLPLSVNGRKTTFLILANTNLDFLFKEDVFSLIEQVILQAQLLIFDIHYDSM